MYTRIALEALKVSYSDVGEGLQWIVKKKLFFLETLYHLLLLHKLLLIYKWFNPHRSDDDTVQKYRNNMCGLVIVVSARPIYKLHLK